MVGQNVRTNRTTTPLIRAASRLESSRGEILRLGGVVVRLPDGQRLYWCAPLSRHGKINGAPRHSGHPVYHSGRS
jgi:hypothetical protein